MGKAKNVKKLARSGQKIAKNVGDQVSDASSKIMKNSKSRKIAPRSNTAIKGSVKKSELHDRTSKGRQAAVTKRREAVAEKEIDEKVKKAMSEIGNSQGIADQIEGMLVGGKAKFDNKDVFSVNAQRQELHKKVNSYRGADEKQIRKMIQSGDYVSPDEILQSAKNAKAKDLTFGQNMAFKKVPQKVAAGGTTAYLVSRMSSSKGQLSNSELYGQSTPYGNF